MMIAPMKNLMNDATSNSAVRRTHNTGGGSIWPAISVTAPSSSAATITMASTEAVSTLPMGGRIFRNGMMTGLVTMSIA